MTVADAAPKIAKIIPRLASEHEGEVLATARAIQRSLDAADADLCDLAEWIARSASKAQAPKASAPPTAPLWAGLAHHERVRWLDALDHCTGVLNNWERRFLDSLAGQMNRAGRFHISEAQAAVVERMIEKAVAAGLTI